MQQQAGEYLSGNLSRRGFVQGLTAAGFSLAAARSALGSLKPLVASSAAPLVADSSISVTGNGGALMAHQLKEFGLRYFFVTNSSGMGVIADALVDIPEIQFIQGVSEHQTMAIADGYAKASGTTAVCGFSRVGGPLGSANMYNAMKDRTPIVVLTDHADSTSQGRDGHEDIEDWLIPFSQYTKWRWLVGEPKRLPEWLAKAFRVSSVPPGGPTLIRVPRDLLYRKDLTVDLFPRHSIDIPVNATPNTDLVERAARMLLEAKNPVLYLSHEVWSTGARSDVVELAELLAIPATQARSWGADFPSDHALYLGGLSTPNRVLPEIDLVLNLGAHVGRVPKSAKLIHARIDTRHMGGRAAPDLSIAASVKETTRALIEAVQSMATKQRLAKIRNERMPRITQGAEALRTALASSAKVLWDMSPVSWPRLLLTLNKMIDPQSIIVTEVGTEDWVLRSFPFADGKKMRIGRTVGRALGWGVGASVGVQLAQPDRQVVSLQGDGGFLFGQSDALWSMSRYDAPVITVVANNHSYDEPRNNMFMRKGRIAETKKDMICNLGSPHVDFTHIARAHGIDGAKVENPGQLEGAIAKAIQTSKNGRPFLLDVEVARTGMGADSTWFPAHSIGASRKS